jgi:hypothetical protein
VQAEAKAVAEQLASVEAALSSERELGKQVGIGWGGKEERLLPYLGCGC